MMRVLVACEYSGVVRDAFTARGHDAISCDLLPSEAPDGKHIQGDATALLNGDWDLIIAHPPCTYLCNSGVRWLHTDPSRWEAMREAARFFLALYHAPCPRVCVENPIQHKHAYELIGRRASQYVQPWWFGHPECKATGLWLRGLTPLVPTDNVYTHMMTLPKAERARVHYASPSKDRWKERSRTLPGLAAAMADQWSN